MSKYAMRAVRLKVPYRLHLGFYRYSDPPHSFGSTGIVVREPYFIMSVERVSGPTVIETPTEESRDLILNTLFRMGVRNGLKVSVEGLVKHHVGLGSRTKLVMSLLKALTVVGCLGPGTRIDAVARGLGVGRVSGVGIHTFLKGGFVVDTGVVKLGNALRYPELLLRLRPPPWSVLVAIPEGITGLREKDEEPILSNVEPHRNQKELYELLIHLTTAVRLSNFGVFSKALSRIQLLAGQYFSRHQGGVYSSEESALIAETLRRSGVEAVGQSSWGPTVYGFVEDGRKAARATAALEGLRASLRLDYWVTKTSVRGFLTEAF
ncbi:MAG: hypothetical protein QXX81_07795 [Zestosphaera sp.]